MKLKKEVNLIIKIHEWGRRLYLDYVFRKLDHIFYGYGRFLKALKDDESFKEFAYEVEITKSIRSKTFNPQRLKDIYSPFKGGRKPF